jgi:hypothetical protein
MTNDGPMTAQRRPNDGPMTAPNVMAPGCQVRICSALRLDFAIPSALDFVFCLLHRLRWPHVFAVHRGMHKQVAMLSQLLCEPSLLRLHADELHLSHS